MSEKIRVKIVDAGGANLQLRFTDPVTGKVVTSTKYVDPSTGEVHRTGKIRKVARKFATLLEADLNAGRTGTGQATSWQAFRSRYEMEVLPTLSDSVQKKVGTVFDSLEKHFPKVTTGKLTTLDAAVLSRFQAELRTEKKAENSITNYLATIRSALSWASRQKLIRDIPNIEFPKLARSRGGYRGKGRAINAEEFDRMLDKIEAALIKARVSNHPTGEIIASWQHLMTGMWLSGLRISEALVLSWDSDAPFAIDLTGRHPRFRIRAEAQKARRDETLPMTPDFANFLLQTPEEKRKGHVFPSVTNRQIAHGVIAPKVIALTGRLAGIKVNTDPKTKRVTFASSRSLRKSFGCRWAIRVTTPVLQRLMRHADIQTTMGYYVDLNSDELAEGLWAQEAKTKAEGYEKGYFPSETTPPTPNVTTYETMD